MARGAGLVLKTIAGTSHHGCAVGAKPLADVAFSYGANVNENHRGTARASDELKCCASSLETVRRVTYGACLGLETAVGTPYFGHAPKKRGL